MKNLIDTDFGNNVGHIKPYLGVILIGSVALMFGTIIYNALNQFTQSVYSNVPDGVGGTLSVRGGVKDIVYGDTIEYRSTASGVGGRNSTTYITTVCFQDDELVFQRSVPQGASVYLYDQVGGVYEWDGHDASCTASLMYREVSGDRINVYVVESTSFEVEGR